MSKDIGNLGNGPLNSREIRSEYTPDRVDQPKPKPPKRKKRKAKARKGK